MDVMSTIDVLFTDNLQKWTNDVQVQNLDTFLKEFIEMTFNLEVKSVYTCKGIGWTKKKKKKKL